MLLNNHQYHCNITKSFLSVHMTNYGRYKNVIWSIETAGQIWQIRELYMFNTYCRSNVGGMGMIYVLWRPQVANDGRYRNDTRMIETIDKTENI